MPNYLAELKRNGSVEAQWFRAETPAAARKLAQQHFIDIGYDGKYGGPGNPRFKRVTLKEIIITPEEKLRG